MQKGTRWAAFSLPEVLIPSIAKVHVSNRVLGGLNAIGRGAVFLQPRAPPPPQQQSPSSLAAGAFTNGFGGGGGGGSSGTPAHGGGGGGGRGGGGAVPPRTMRSRGFSPGSSKSAATAGPAAVNAVRRFVSEISTATSAGQAQSREARRLLEALPLLGS